MQVTSQQLQVMLTSIVRMGKKCDFDFDCGMIVDARQAGLSISDTSADLGFSGTAVSKPYPAAFATPRNLRTSRCTTHLRQLPTARTGFV